METTSRPASMPAQSLATKLIVPATCFGAGIVAVCALLAIAFALMVRAGLKEISRLGPWPGPGAAPAQVVAVDLAHLGLEAGDVGDARLEETWADAGYAEGAIRVFRVRNKDVAVIWALRYATPDEAAADYTSARIWAESGSCGAYSTAYFGYEGLIRCWSSQAYNKTFWHEHWIIDVLAMTGSAYSPDVLVDLVRDAIASRWQGLGAAAGDDALRLYSVD